VRKDPNGAPQSHFLWDRDNLLAELTGTGTALVAEYSYYGPDQLHALFVGGTEYNAHADGLGNVIALTDGAQTVTRTYGYTAWGQSAGGSDLRPFTNADRARFKGALWLGPEVDLYYMRARWYEPQSGRFLSEDPVGLEGGLNAYVYTSDDPVNSSDPLGLDEEPLEPPSPCEGAVDVLACLTGDWGGGGGGGGSGADSFGFGLGGGGGGNPGQQPKANKPGPRPQQKPSWRQCMADAVNAGAAATQVLVGGALVGGGRIVERVGVQTFVRGVASPGFFDEAAAQEGSAVLINGGRLLYGAGVGLQITGVVVGGLTVGYAAGAALMCKIDSSYYR